MSEDGYNLTHLQALLNDAVGYAAELAGLRVLDAVFGLWEGGEAGKTYLLKADRALVLVRASLDGPGKVATVAHEAAHVVIGPARSTWLEEAVAELYAVHYLRARGMPEAARDLDAVRRAEAKGVDPGAIADYPPHYGLAYVAGLALLGAGLDLRALLRSVAQR